MKSVINNASKTTPLRRGDQLLGYDIRSVGGVSGGYVTFQFKATGDFEIDLEGRLPGMDWGSYGTFDQTKDEIQTFIASPQADYRVRWISGADVTVAWGA